MNDLDEIRNIANNSVTITEANNILTDLITRAVKDYAQKTYEKFIKELRNKVDNFKFSDVYGRKFIDGDITINKNFDFFPTTTVTNKEISAVKLFSKEKELFKNNSLIKDIEYIYYYECQKRAQYYIDGEIKYHTTQPEYFRIRIKLVSYEWKTQKHLFSKSTFYSFFSTETGKVFYNEFLKIANDTRTVFEFCAQFFENSSFIIERKIPSNEMRQKCDFNTYRDYELRAAIRYKISC